MHSDPRERPGRCAACVVARSTENQPVIRRALVLMAPCLLLFAAAAFAQNNADGIDAVNIQPLEFERPLVEYILAAVFLLTALGIGFKPSKRAHDA